MVPLTNIQNEQEHSIVGNVEEGALGHDVGKDEDNSVADDSVASTGSESNCLKGNCSRSNSAAAAVPLHYSETVAVNRSKLLVYVSLIAVAAAAGAMTWLFLSREEQGDFEQEFLSYSKEIHTVSEDNIGYIFGQVQSLAMSLTARGLSTGYNQTWPFVTLPYFSTRALQQDDQTGAELIIFAPKVPEVNLSDWEAYSVANQGWIDEDVNYNETSFSHPGPIPNEVRPWPGTQRLPFSPSAVYGKDPFVVPVWQLGPTPQSSMIINTDLFTNPPMARMIKDVLEIKHDLLSEVTDTDALYTMVFPEEYRTLELEPGPRSYVVKPIFSDFEDEQSDVVGFLLAFLRWDEFFRNILPMGMTGLTVHVKDTCISDFTFSIEGREAIYVGLGDLHDPAYDSLRQEFDFAEKTRYDGGDVDNLNSHCLYTIQVYPSATFEKQFLTTNPLWHAFLVCLVFMFTISVFAVYDFLVQRRQSKMLSHAERTTAIVTSIFPKSVTERLMDDAADRMEKAQNKKSNFHKTKSASSSERECMNSDDDEEYILFKNKPIADLFPEATIMFADLVGFTAWSSTHEPEQVFTLLEVIYHAFDEIANKRRVFKVETVGDCYVAVAGLPDPRPDHALVMCRFARECFCKFQCLIKRLEIKLGPETSELNFRFGLHSGPVTAGVLRGERSRFQLFGDTVNTTSRVETTGLPGKIHVSSNTAALLKASGKGHWVRQREDRVVAKGKGELETYWLETIVKAGSDKGSESDSGADHTTSLLRGGTCSDVKTQQMDKSEHLNITTREELHIVPDRVQRLVDWNQDLLLHHLRKVVARRNFVGTKSDSEAHLLLVESELSDKVDCLEEMRGVLDMPTFNFTALQTQKQTDEIVLSEDVVGQLRHFTQSIAAAYNNENVFHNFEHASRATMSVVKLLNRLNRVKGVEEDEQTAAELHKTTCGIASDPLTQFAVVFSALVHGVNHPGVPNSQLVKEGASVAVTCNNRSVAEQNSLHIAWSLLMDPTYKDLRRMLYTNETDLRRFRQTVAIAVMATDIMDEDQASNRLARWNTYFSPPQNTTEEHIGERATLVLEYMMQASYVSHAMQHWQIYRKWNKLLFNEMRNAFLQGRADKDPADGWWSRELSFLDSFVIPLAAKLKESGVFGPSSEEYLSYAHEIRDRWLSEGVNVVAEMIGFEKLRLDF